MLQDEIDRGCRKWTDGRGTSCSKEMDQEAKVKGTLEELVEVVLVHD